jgi:hypothetical protein
MSSCTPAFMTAKQRKFCKAYILTGDKVKSALVAGYSASTANSRTATIMAAPLVKSFIEHMQRRSKRRVLLNREYIIKKLGLVIERAIPDDMCVIVPDGYEPNVGLKAIDITNKMQQNYGANESVSEEEASKAKAILDAYVQQNRKEF